MGVEHREELNRRQAELGNFQRLRAEQERQGRLAEANRNIQNQQAQRALFRNELPRSPVAAAAGPRFGNRGPVEAPGFPANQAAYRPQFNPQHNEVPLITHREGGLPHPVERRPEPERRPGEERRGPERGRPR